MKSACKVLVVEDDVYVREIMGDVVEAEGYEIALAGNGDEMRRALADDPTIDVIVIDVALPGALDGLELARETAAAGYGVVLVTGDPNRFDAVARSGHHHLFKPCHAIDLTRLIERVLEETGRECRRPQHAGRS